MPSQFHETLLLLFRNRPELAPELIRDALHLALPDYTDVRVDSAEFSDVQPAQYRADLVLLLSRDSPILGVVVEVQLSPDEDKRYAWPVYVVNLRARIRCPVCLLVVASEDRVARWASQRIHLGGENYFVPWVLGPTDVPEITDPERAQEDPEMAVLSALSHAQNPDRAKSTLIARCAQLASMRLDADRSRLYCDLVLDTLSEAARMALPKVHVNRFNYEYRSEFARRYVAEGEAKMVLKLLTTRFGTLSSVATARFKTASPSEVEDIAERLLMGAQTLDEALGSH